MRFFIGAVALTVICAIFGTPAVLVLGWSGLTASERQSLSTIRKDRGKLSHIEKHLRKPPPEKTAVN